MSTNAFELIKSGMRLSDYIGRFTKLKSSGSADRFRGPCPLHESGNASTMSVDNSAANGTGLWKCQVECGGGSIIDFYMKANSLTDVSDALEGLSSDIGVKLPEREANGRTEVSTRRQKEAMLAVAEAALDLLLDGECEDSGAAYDYLRGRKVTDKVIDEWMIGFIPAGEAAVEFVLEACGDKAAAVESGVLVKREIDGNLYCPFSGRVTFPILDARGDVIAFGAREIEGVRSFGGKYVNTGGTKLYDKSKVLYGMDRLKGAQRGYVVEGYLDAIAATLAGDGVGLAPCGTALTVGHTKLLEELDEVVNLFDADVPGQKALAASYWVVNKLGERAKATIVESGKDPWELYATDREALTRSLTENLQPALHAAIDARYIFSPNDADFDRWVSSVISALVRSDHKDSAIRKAASLRKQSVTTYSRGLTSVSLRSPVADNVAVAALEPNMQSLIRRLLQMTEVEKEGALAGIASWSPAVEEALRTWLPVGTELDLEAFGRVAVGGVAWEHSSEADRAVALLLPDDDSEVEDITTPLRNVITLMSHESRKLCADATTSPVLIRQMHALRRINGAVREIDQQPTVLAFLLDLMVDMSRQRRVIDASAAA